MRSSSCKFCSLQPCLSGTFWWIIQKTRFFGPECWHSQPMWHLSLIFSPIFTLVWSHSLRPTDVAGITESYGSGGDWSWFTSGYCQDSLHKAPGPNYEVLDLVWSCLTLYVSQFLKKLTEPSTLLWITVQPPGSCLWSHHTCISRLAFSGFTRNMPLAVWPSSRACRQSLNGPGQKDGKTCNMRSVNTVSQE